MGAKTWMLAYSEGNADTILKTKPLLDNAASLALAKRVFPRTKRLPSIDGNLSCTCPEDDEIFIGCFKGLSIMAATEFAIDYPSQLPRQFIDAAQGQTVYLHAMHSSVDWFAFAIWENGKLQRSLSLSADSGILEDIGSKCGFEEPYWAGQYPAIDEEDDDEEYAFPFHPLELAEATLLALFGYQLEGVLDPSQIESDDIPLLGFKRIKPWWKIG